MKARAKERYKHINVSAVNHRWYFLPTILLFIDKPLGIHYWSFNWLCLTICIWKKIS